MTEINANGSKTVYPENEKLDVEFGLSEPNNIRFTNSDGKILAEVPTDDLVSKEQDDIYRAFGIDPSLAKKVLGEKPDHAADYLDALRYALESQQNENTKPDMVNHPPHYNVNGFEVIDIIKAFTEGLNGIAAVDTGNAIKYILRWQHKNGIEDLKKARWYIDHLIKELEK